jgi:hypothetical protein
VTSTAGEVKQTPNVLTVDAMTCAAPTDKTTITVQENTTGDVVYVNPQGLDGYALTACYLTGTLDAAGNSDCVSAGAYCCFPPHKLGDTVPVGHVGSTPTDLYLIGLESLPDVSTAGPHPFSHWRTPTWDASALPSRGCSVIVDDTVVP